MSIRWDYRDICPCRACVTLSRLYAIYGYQDPGSWREFMDRRVNGFSMDWRRDWLDAPFPSRDGCEKPNPEYRGLKEAARQTKQSLGWVNA